ncbi:hypothetical protein TNCV_2232041 [Trichonephila clavipes]|nr:hypothetical protein TNCV_2232041 [Trichonephila clavipes]
MPFAKKRKEICHSLRQVRLLHDSWRHHLSPTPQFRHRPEGKEIFSSALHPRFSATAHSTFGLADLTSAYSVCTLRVFGGSGIEPSPSGLESGALTTKLPMTSRRDIEIRVSAN